MKRKLRVQLRHLGLDLAYDVEYSFDEHGQLNDIEGSLVAIGENLREPTPDEVRAFSMLTPDGATTSMGYRVVFALYKALENS